MPRKTKEETVARAPKSRQSLEDLLSQVPTSVFMQMLVRSGMPTDDQRALADKFRELKG